MVKKVFIDQGSIKITSFADSATQAHISKRVFQKCDEKVRRYVSRPEQGLDKNLEAVRASEFLAECRILIEEDARRLAAKFSPCRWLWYLRRLPHTVFEGELPTTAGYDHALAEAISGSSENDQDYHKTQDGRITYIVNQPVLKLVLEYCETVRYLSRIHVGLRWAGKDVNFRFRDEQSALPYPVPSADEREAVDLYDTRVIENWAFFGRTGTKGASEFESDSATEAYEKRALPVIDRLRRPLLGTVAVQEFDESFVDVESDYNYQFRLLSLSELIALNSDPRLSGAKWWHPEAESLMLLLFLSLKFLVYLPYYQVSIMKFGYFVVQYESIAAMPNSYIEDAAQLASKVLPRADFPSSATELFERLENMGGASYPLLPGPPVLSERDSVWVDIYTTASRLHYRLEFPRADGDVKPRSEHFELIVQGIIDSSPWAPSEVLRSLRGRKLKYNQQSITDVDAIGTRGKVVLLVSCKSRVYSSDYDIGKHNVVRNERVKLLEDVEFWDAKMRFFQEHPKGDDGCNYDFSAFDEILGVVCTPHPVYVPIGIATKIRKSGLRGTVTHVELQKWLTA